MVPVTYFLKDFCSYECLNFILTWKFNNRFFDIIRIVKTFDKVEWIRNQQSAIKFHSHHSQLSFKRQLGIRELMIVSSNDRTEDDGSVHVTIGKIIIIIILHAWKDFRIFYFEETFVILRNQTLLKENDGILMPITNEALFFLTEFPLIRCINLEKPLPWIAIKMRILVPYQLWVVNFPGYHKCVYFVTVISTNALACSRPKFIFVLFY